MFPDILNEVSEIMQRDVVKTPPTSTLEEAAKSMQERNVGSIVVVEADKAVGVLTERDFLKQAALGSDPKQVKVRSAMSSPAISCELSTKIDDAYSIMRKHRIRHLVIEDNKGKPVGVLSIRDLIANGQLIL